VETPQPQTYLVLSVVGEPRQFSLDAKSYWTVGRNQENDIVITDHCISRNHAILQGTDTGEFLLIDLGSRNGTFVNGRRVSVPVTLRHEDEITFGKT
jgi:adenylate cyclase